ncbi:MAG: hypothetical protein LBK13_05465 [Spirochaetales bacterium]|jgi:hypothetical protein|nr:hypothetical protein [Spirochaetales bacterium]
MENNKTDLPFLLEKAYNFHDSNIENIFIIYRTFDNSCVEDYPKETTDMQIEISLPDNSDIAFSQKKIKLNFYEIEEFRIGKSIKWSWLITSAAIETNESSKTNLFSIDDFLYLNYKTFNWNFVNMKT